MNHSDEILKELKVISDYFKKQERAAKRARWILFSTILFLGLIGSGFSVFLNNQMDKIGDYGAAPSEEAQWKWYHVRQSIEHGNLAEGIKIGKALMIRSPNYAYGHIRLGELYNMSGDIEKAHAEFKKACDILPTSKNLDYLKAIEDRLQKNHHLE